MIPLALLGVALIAAGLVWRALDVWREAATRRIALEEQRAAALLAEQQRGADPVAIPADLYALAYRESEPWARDDLLATMRQAWYDCRDWDTVKQTLGTKLVRDALASDRPYVGRGPDGEYLS